KRLLERLDQHGGPRIVFIVLTWIGLADFSVYGEKTGRGRGRWWRSWWRRMSLRAQRQLLCCASSEKVDEPFAATGLTIESRSELAVAGRDCQLRREFPKIRVI